MKEKIDQHTFWNEIAGPLWVINQTKHDRLLAPLTEALVQEAVPAQGEHVLDVGAGCGDLSLQVAEAVGSGGRVLGIDISKPMLALAKKRYHEEERVARAPIEWIEADAMTHAFEPDFDLVISRFGVMFFADKARAFANLRRAVKPGGRFVFLTWRRRAEVEWMQAPLEWIEPALPMPELRDGEPGPFGLCDGEATRELLADAGFHEVVAEPLDRELLIGETVDEAFSLLLDTGPAAGAIREAEPPASEEAKRRLRENLERVAMKDGRVELRGACFVYRGVL